MVAVSAQVRARTSLCIVLSILAVLWIIQIINNADHYNLSVHFAIRPRIAADLPYILTAPFLHWSWSHIEGNSLPLVVLGFLASYRSIPKFIGVTAIVVVTSGLLFWIIAPSGSEAVGASGVIFGWFGYVIVRGFFNHHKIDIVVGLLVMLYYLPIFDLLLPAAHLAYQAHVGGLVGGVCSGFAFRTRPTGAAVEAGPSPEMATNAEAPAAITRSPISKIEGELAALREEIAGERRKSNDRSEQQ